MSQLSKFAPRGRSWEDGPPELTKPVTEWEAYTVFRELKPRSVAGVDFIEWEQVRRLLPIFFLYRLPLSRVLIRAGIWPMLWAIGRVTVLG